MTTSLKVSLHEIVLGVDDKTVTIGGDMTVSGGFQAMTYPFDHWDPPHEFEMITDEERLLGGQRIQQDKTYAPLTVVGQPANVSRPSGPRSDQQLLSSSSLAKWPVVHFGPFSIPFQKLCH